MIDSIFAMFLNIFDSIFGWISAINLKIPFLFVALGLFLATTLIRYIIMPLLSTSSASDLASIDKPKRTYGVKH